MRQSYMQLCTSVSINKESINKEKYKQRNNKKYKATFIINCFMQKVWFFDYLFLAYSDYQLRSFDWDKKEISKKLINKSN